MDDKIKLRNDYLNGKALFSHGQLSRGTLTDEGWLQPPEREATEHEAMMGAGDMRAALIKMLQEGGAIYDEAARDLAWALESLNQGQVTLMFKPKAFKADRITPIIDEATDREFIARKIMIENLRSLGAVPPEYVAGLIDVLKAADHGRLKGLAAPFNQQGGADSILTQPQPYFPQGKPIVEIKELTNERALEWLKRQCWTLGEAHWLLSGFDPDSRVVNTITPQANAGNDVERLQRYIDAGLLKPLNKNTNNEDVFAPLGLIEAALTVEFGMTRAWINLLITSSTSFKPQRNVQELSQTLIEPEVKTFKQNIRNWAEQLGVIVKTGTPETGEDRGEIKWMNYSESVSIASLGLTLLGISKRRAEGRYTLEEAALLIEAKTGERAREIVKKFEIAAENRELRTYESEKYATYLYQEGFANRVQKYHQESYWDDLNQWLEQKEPRMTFRFPDPASLNCATKVVSQHLEYASETNDAPIEGIKVTTQYPEIVQTRTCIDDLHPIPGTMPRVAICRLAIEAAWQIECETKRGGSSKQVMERLQTWADDGSKPDVLHKSIKGKSAVEWRTTKSKFKEFDIAACEKALQRWEKSRQ